jgi:DNA-binding Lrp family transcriptional regulator
VVTAIILVRSARQALHTLGPRLAEVRGVAEVYTVTGDWDFVGIVRLRHHEELAELVTAELAKLEGIEQTQTMVAFQQFSQHDLEAMFGLGAEPG